MTRRYPLWRDSHRGTETRAVGARQATSVRGAAAGALDLLVSSLGRSGAALLNLGWRCTHRQSGVVLVYHGIGDPQGDWRRELVPLLGTRLFDAQLRHIHRRYRVVPASAILEATTARRRWERFPVAISFDDDLASHSRTAAPALRKRGLRATFFLSGASLDSPSTFWWERLQAAADRGLPIEELAPDPDRPPTVHVVAEAIEAMTPDERGVVERRLDDWLRGAPAPAALSRRDLARLVAEGHEIGFHTLQHHRLPGLDDAQLLAAMRNGREALATAIGRPIDLIAYPHGVADPRVARAAGSSPYRRGFTAEPVPVRPDTDALLIGRLGPSYASAGHHALKLALTLFRRSRTDGSRLAAVRRRALRRLWDEPS